MMIINTIVSIGASVEGENAPQMKKCDLRWASTTSGHSFSGSDWVRSQPPQLPAEEELTAITR